MALANKCDRCGKLYERRINNDAYKVKKVLVHYTEADIDLCSECQEAFEKFMKSCEKTNIRKGEES